VGWKGEEIHEIHFFLSCFIIYLSFIHYCIFSDSQGWDDVGFHGSRQIPTPNIDAMATEGVILNNYYVSPMCTPTRASIMSGKHPIHLGRFQYNCSYSPLSYLHNKETKNSAQRYRNASKETRVIKLEARIFRNGRYWGIMTATVALLIVLLAYMKCR